MSNAKIVPLGQIAERVKELRVAGKKIVATNGCFDVLHVGHIRYLEAARKLGDALVIGINGDKSVRELKGAGRPVNSETDRAEVVAALKAVDLVTVFPEVRASHFLRMVAPDVYVKGGDYNENTLNSEEREVLKKIGAKIDIVPFEKGYSTSGLLARMSKSEK